MLSIELVSRTLLRFSSILLLTILTVATLAMRPSTSLAACVGGAPNGLVELGEACDDNDASNSDFCLTNCTLATCGDNIECTDPDCSLAGGVEECDTGVLRSDVVANACRTTCQDPSCGDAVTDAGEECDDGDASNADFCLTSCNWAGCGDGFQCTDNAGADACANSPDLAGVEACDDGNNSNNDACVNTCVLAFCTDGFVRTGVEACDDGNVNNVDGCASNCTLPLCGNGVVQAGEECDDGNLVNALDACPNSCQNHECGDGILAIPENCDDANNVNTDACKNDCTFGICGDGVVRAGFEACDDGNVNNNDACKNDCSDNACGDGVVETGVEECDLGGGNSDVLANGCRTNCELWHCGDGVTDGPENCDDANNANTDACKNNCTFATCGDGVVRAGVEICDDSNVANGDGCSSTCFVEGCGDGQVDAPETCDPQVLGTNPPVPLETVSCDLDCTAVACADGVTNTIWGEQCDDGNLACNDGCCGCGVLEFCGDGITQAGLGEECDNAGANSDSVMDACRTNCKLAHCGDGVTDTPENCDDDNLIETDACHNDCTFNVCGDAVIDTTQEQCDDADLDNTDGCTTACVSASCGDGIIQVQDNEECDDGNDAICVGGGYNAGAICLEDSDCLGICSGATPNPGQPCTTATVAADCGSLVGCLTAGVVCADTAGVNNSDEVADACRSTCQQASCGDGVIDSPENCEGPAGPSNPCVITNAGGAPSLVEPLNCAFASCGDGVVCSSGTCTSGPGGSVEECDDDNGSNTDACLNDCAAATCGDGVTQAGVEECDDGPATCLAGYDVGEVCTEHADCRGVCGVGTVNPGAPCTQAIDIAACGNPGTCTLLGGNCDLAGNNNDEGADDCRSDCQLWFCGDGVTDSPENCDDGNTSNTDACKTNCTFNVCGDGEVEAGVETCDDGNVANGDGCSSICLVEGCGDGIVQAGEACEGQAVPNTNPPVPVETAGCDLDCTLAICADNVANAAAGEECDDGNATADDGCTGCPGIEDFCGDGTDNDGDLEECDDGVGNDDTLADACRTTCMLAGCGDDVTDSGEDCDESGEAAACDDDCTLVSCGDGNHNEAAGEECDNGGANNNASDACRASTNHVPPFFFDACDLPRHADGILDPSIGEICDAGPAGDATCNPDGCSTGTSPDSYLNGYSGATCELGMLNAACVDDIAVGLDECKRAKNIHRHLDQIADRLEMSKYREELGNLGLAENNARTARRRAQRLAAKIVKFCPDGDLVQVCLRDVHLPHMIDILIELESNIAANEP